MLVFFAKGGIIMWPILLCSVISVAVFIERLISLQHKKFLPREFLIEIQDLLKEKRFSDAVISCKKNKSIISRLVLPVIKSERKSREYLKTLLDEHGQREIELVSRPNSVLSTIANISPLLGLLGTVTGMIKVFSVISVEGVGNPASLAAGISEALFTTVAGLVVAIPTFVAFKYFQSKLRNNSVLLEEESFKLIDVISEGHV
ncbi:MAG: MotA/TolQ/ExbB proton channel family protein [Oligoflexia bacterium]|nr:MotA/TolQ/ExbB proton channel family protein [Oligoflexia bacterium]